MALQEVLEVIVNGTNAKKNISEIEAEIKKLKDFGETGIRLELDENGEVKRVLSQLKNETGAVVNYVRQWNEETKQLEQTSASISVNLEKAEKLQEESARRRLSVLQDEMRLRIQEAENKRKAAEADAESSRIAADLLAKEEALNQKAAERAQKEKEIAEAKARQAAHDDRQQGLNLTFANWKDWGADSNYTQRLANSFVNAQVPLQQYIDSLTGVEREQSQINATTSVFATISDKAYGEYAAKNNLAAEANENLSSSAKTAASSQQTLGNETEEAGKKAEKSGKAFTLLYSIFLRLAHTAISAVTRSFREALTEMKNVDSELVVVRKVSDASAEELAVLKDRAYEVGAAYGVLASDYLNAAAEMTRAGYREQAGDLAELATKLQLVGDVSQDVANQFLIATDKSYKMGGNFQKLSATIDKLNEIDNNFATSFEKVADGIGLLAPVAAQANVSFDEMAAAIGTVTAVTQRSGTESARALRSLFLNIIRDTDTEIEDGVTWTVEEINNVSDALKKYAPEVVKAADATGELINPMEAVGALAQSYKEGLLTNQDLFEIVSGLGFV